MIFEWDASHASHMLDQVIDAMSDGQVQVFFDDTVESWLQERATARFRSQGDDASLPWAALSAATIRTRLREGYRAGPINLREGDLMEYVIHSHGRTENLGEEIVFNFPGSDVQGDLGAKLAGAQLGTKGGKGGKGAPARPVLAVGEMDQQYILASFWQHIERQVHD